MADLIAVRGDITEQHAHAARCGWPSTRFSAKSPEGLLRDPNMSVAAAMVVR
ncbi:hypothetical protein [Nocardia sp. NPDC127526]|uniref:hypothetical protein n=1 Tax=Nocardia sp. NPDC127526 TaxID=3345393 RepID=UPI0036420478